MVKNIRLATKNLWLVALLPAAVLTTSACGGEPESLEGARVEERQEPLWQHENWRPWLAGIIVVCFEPSISPTLRTTIRQQVESTWEDAGNVDFIVWDNCPSSIPNGVVAVRMNPSLPEETLGQTIRQVDPATAPAAVEFRTTPTNRTILHEFGHVLGFHEENSGVNPCTQRTSGGASYEWEPDMNSSVMSQTQCNNSNGALSAWDILGLRMVYGQKPPGTIAGRNGTRLIIENGSTTVGRPIILWGGTAGLWNTKWVRPATGSQLLTAYTGNTQRCLNVSGGVVGPGFTPVISWTCSESFFNEYFRFSGVHWRAMGNRCVQADSNSNGARLSIQPCNPAISLQKWDFFDANFRIRLQGTDRCVTVPGGSTLLGTQLELQPCGGSFNTFGYASSHITFSGRCFNVLGGTTANGNRIGLWSGCFATPPLHNSQFTIRGQVTALGQCLDTNTASHSVGASVGVKPCGAFGSSTQTWEYYW